MNADATLNMTRKLTLALLIAAAIASAQPLRAQGFLCEQNFNLDDAAMKPFQYGPQPPPARVLQADPDPLKLRLLKYAAVAMKHRLNGLASYYSTSLDGTLTANGERYHNQKMSAAHLTLPLGSWVEITSRATGRKLRLRVNDRGPYVNKFVIDLSQAAARYLGVDVAEDRSVLIRIIGLPGEDPLPQDVIDGPRTPGLEETTVALLPSGQ
jgi:rare lipoprotein A